MRPTDGGKHADIPNGGMRLDPTDPWKHLK